ncbi:hypothetical protein HYN48_13495 [Flavobacterium magnum]|uniref:Uncharacterized protein n=1 Tax=Flavobacterium magnum TaxID=2162713 RepID=A0A2S0RH70_9FLAO|nr:hypothetical protein [Flavobacterium magnum]AWA31014.1 hypothetical protein HYN48_13495 [Flavobacterium magnum]
MKTLVLLAFLLIAVKSEIPGIYRSHFGSTLTLNNDHTFYYSWKFDLASSWSQGKWTNNKDTIYFDLIPVYDTLRLADKPDSLVLSSTNKPKIITDNNTFAITAVSGGGQNRYPIMIKLFHKNGKLYVINNSGKLETKKVKSLSNTNEEYKTWFFKK